MLVDVPAGIVWGVGMATIAGGMLTGVKVALKELVIDWPSPLTMTTVIFAVPALLGTGLTVTVQLVPLPLKEIPPLVTTDGVSEVPVKVKTGVDRVSSATVKSSRAEVFSGT